MILEEMKNFIGSLFIPKGLYCRGDNNKRCVFYNHATIYNKQNPSQEIKLPYCDFLNLGDLGNKLTDEEYEVLKKVFTEEEIRENFPLMILWDECKECGINSKYKDEK